jgi:hypothetical protein
MVANPAQANPFDGRAKGRLRLIQNIAHYTPHLLGQQSLSNIEHFRALASPFKPRSGCVLCE